MTDSYLKRTLPATFAVLCGPHPPDTSCFETGSFQMLWNASDKPWSDDGLHAHTDSDEAYLTLEGSLTLDIDDTIVTVAAGEICFVSRGVPHAMTTVDVPYKGFVIRAPSLQDKIHPGSGDNQHGTQNAQ